MFKLNTNTNIDALLEDIGIDKAAHKILADKMQLHFIKITKLDTKAAIILKQDALSIGADVATPRHTIEYTTPTVDVILIGTTKQLKLLGKKALAQPFGLKKVALYLQNITHTQKRQKAQIMGVVNINQDSFYANSRFDAKASVVHIQKLIDEGAHTIDVGAVSSRPGSPSVPFDEELVRIKSTIDAIYEARLYEKARFSIDSYAPNVLEYALSHGFSIVNDITGLRDDAVCEVAAKYDATVVIMHMQNSPQTMQVNPSYENVITEVYAFFEAQIKKAHQFGINDIVLDVGIGFGKSLEHNLMLLAHLESFVSLGYPLLVGASRKSLIDALSPSEVEKRLAGTLALHLAAVRNGASIIRCHDVFEHTQSLRIEYALNETF